MCCHCHIRLMSWLRLELLSMSLMSWWIGPGRQNFEGKDKVEVFNPRALSSWWIAADWETSNNQNFIHFSQKIEFRWQLQKKNRCFEQKTWDTWQFRFHKKLKSSNFSFSKSFSTQNAYLSIHSHSNDVIFIPLDVTAAARFISEGWPLFQLK